MSSFHKSSVAVDKLLSQPLWKLLTRSFVEKTTANTRIRFSSFERKRIQQCCAEITASKELTIPALSVQIGPLRTWINSNKPLSAKFKAYLAHLGIDTE